MKKFYIEKKIYYHDTDCGGVVYYANYLKHFEEGRAEYFASRGISLKGLAQQGTNFVVARVEINYKAPARYQDIVKIVTGIEKTGTASLHFAQEIIRGDSVLVEAKTTVVCVGKDIKPKAIPKEVKSSLES